MQTADKLLAKGGPARNSVIFHNARLAHFLNEVFFREFYKCLNSTLRSSIINYFNHLLTPGGLFTEVE